MGLLIAIGQCVRNRKRQEDGKSFTEDTFNHFSTLGFMW